MFSIVQVYCGLSLYSIEYHCSTTFGRLVYDSIVVHSIVFYSIVVQDCIAHFWYTIILSDSERQ